jgi:chorismate mutase
MSDIEDIREELDGITERIIELLWERDRLVMRVGKMKRELELQILDPDREKEIIERAERSALRKGLDPAYAKEVVGLMIRHGRGLQG